MNLSFQLRKMGQYYSLHRAVVKTGTVCRKVQPSEAPEFLNRTDLVESWWRGGTSRWAELRRTRGSMKLSLQDIPPKAENDSRHRCRDPWLWPQSLLIPDLFLPPTPRSQRSAAQRPHLSADCLDGVCPATRSRTGSASIEGVRVPTLTQCSAQAASSGSGGK